MANSGTETTTFAELQKAGGQDRGEGRGQKAARTQARRGEGDLEGTHCQREARDGVGGGGVLRG